MFAFLAKLGSAEARLEHVSNVHYAGSVFFSFVWKENLFVRIHILLNDLLQICG